MKNWDIEISAFADTYVDENTIKFNVSENALQLVGVNSPYGFLLSKHNFEMIEEAISELKPEKGERAYHIKLKHVEISGSHWEPSEEWFEVVEMLLVPWQCEYCGKPIEESEHEENERYGQASFCSQYCAEIANGTPMPVSHGALVFDRIFNQNEIKLA